MEKESWNGEGDLIDEAEAKALGLKNSCPPSMLCRHCGEPVRPLGVAVAGSMFWVGHVSCGCRGEREELERESRRAADEDRRRALERSKRSGIPLKYMGVWAENSVCQSYAASFEWGSPAGLYLFGGVGTGKTHNASGVAQQIASTGGSVVFTSAMDLLSNIQETFSSSASSAKELSRYVTCGLLVLDDLGKESASRWSVSTLFSLVNGRYERMLPTVFTSQYDLNALERRLAQRGESETARAIASRIAETCLMVRLDGPDRRRMGNAPAQGGEPSFLDSF